MTDRYDVNPMPGLLDVRCPRCAGKARFEHAGFRVSRDRPTSRAMKKSKEFDFMTVTGHGGLERLGVFYQGYRRTNDLNIPLPEHNPGRGATAPLQKRGHYYLPHGARDRGTVICAACGLRRKTTLAWPQDAWYQVDYRGQVLWAFDRETAVELRDYIASTTRKKTDYRHYLFLLHIPSVFLGAKARAPIVKKLEALLNSA